MHVDGALYVLKVTISIHSCQSLSEKANRQTLTGRGIFSFVGSFPLEDIIERMVMTTLLYLLVAPISSIYNINIEILKDSIPQDVFHDGSWLHIRLFKG